MVQTESGEREQTSEGVVFHVVKRVVAETEPLDVLQALKGGTVCGQRL